MKVIKIQGDLHLALKKMAIGRGMTLQALVDELLRKLTKGGSK